METKTFEAFTMREALKAVKSHFGQDAVILNTRERRIEGARGKVIEVTAARNTDVGPKGEGRSQIAQNNGLKDHLFEMMDYFRGIERSIKALSEDVVRRQDLFRIDAGLHEIRTLMADSLTKKGHGSLKNIPENLAKLFQRLQIMNVDEGELVRLLDHLKALEPKEQGRPEELAEFYKNHSIRWMMKRLKVAPTWNPTQGEKVIQVIVGSSGSGKTSVVAKLAAHYQQKYKKNVIVVSFDNKRLAAREQLRLLAKVLGLQFETIEEPAQLRDVIAGKKEWDMCFVDTSAECPRSADDIHDFLVLRELDLPLRFHLTLSIAEKEAQLDRMIRGFSPLGIDSLIFNRLDESWSYGEIFNVCIRWGLPLSFFGVGRNIPEDLEKASRERVVERIFGL